MIRPITLLLTLAGIALASDAEAQHFVRRGHAPKPVAVSSQAMGTASSPDRSVAQSSRADEFPFHGTPYGRPYEPWTWPKMSGSYASGLARYNQSPLK